MAAPVEPRACGLGHSTPSSGSSGRRGDVHTFAGPLPTAHVKPTNRLQCVIQKVALGYWLSLILPGIQTGFCGALTTVSTFVTEVGSHGAARTAGPAGALLHARTGAWCSLPALSEAIYCVSGRLSPRAQVVKFAELFPESGTAYTYSFLSIGGGVLLGIAIFGWAVWSS